MGHCAAPGPGESSPSFHCVCECVRGGLVFWDMLHSERKCVGMCLFSTQGKNAERHFTLHRINKGSLHQYLICLHICNKQLFKFQLISF